MYPGTKNEVSKVKAFKSYSTNSTDRHADRRDRTHYHSHTRGW